MEICHVNASCLYNEGVGKYLCACNHGFEGDGTTCYSKGFYSKLLCGVFIVPFQATAILTQNAEDTHSVFLTREAE